jgi:hypothetical protein
MAVSSIIERLGKAIFEAPFGGERISKDAPELAEIRLAVMDKIKEKAHRAGGKYVFPYNLIRIKLVGVPEEQSPVFRSDFLAGYFADELRAGLTRSSYRFPEDLSVEILTVPDMPSAKEPWLTVETFLVGPKTAPVAAPQVATLTVLKGQAEPPHLTLKSRRINLGRSQQVIQANGPSRLNDIAFLEADAIGLTVSRQHAHIDFEYDAGEYRLFNDRIYKGADNCNLYLLREGQTIPVHRGGHGALLRTGDEIHLGQAVLRFELISRQSAPQVSTFVGSR